jgi:hypothetical protein
MLVLMTTALVWQRVSSHVEEEEEEGGGRIAKVIRCGSQSYNTLFEGSEKQLIDSAASISSMRNGTKSCTSLLRTNHSVTLSERHGTNALCMIAVDVAVSVRRVNRQCLLVVIKS